MFLTQEQTRALDKTIVQLTRKIGRGTAGPSSFDDNENYGDRVMQLTQALENLIKIRHGHGA